MNQTLATFAVLAAEDTPLPASAIPNLSRDEVVPLAREELARFLALLETLTPEDWDQPTDCSLWTVKDIVAHQASHVLALTHVREFLDQFNPVNLRDYTRRGMNSLDAANQRQVDKRAGWTPAQLIAEMRANSEASFRGRQQFPSLLRWFRVPSPGYDQRVSIGYLIDTIFTRDMWMHRLDLCRATGRPMAQTADHDGRLTALVVRDLDQRLLAKLNGRAVHYRLAGPSGGEWIVGGSGSPAATVSMDALDVHRLASGRISPAQALQDGLATIHNDQALGNLALRNTVVLY